MKLTAGQAAKAVGRTTPSITNAIKKGRISAEKTDGGGYLIDPAELHRVFPPIAVDSKAKPLPLGSETPNHTEALQVEIKLLRERIEDKEAVINDLRQDRDHWREQAERATRLIPPPQSAPAAPTLATERPKRRWWPFGKAND